MKLAIQAAFVVLLSLLTGCERITAPAAFQSEEFNAFLRANQAAAAQDRALVSRGRDVFLQSPCVMCHTIRGTHALSRVGPDLTHLASRRMIAAGTLPNTRGNLAGWILNPQHLKPGSKMPPSLLGSDDLHALLAYLGSLR